MKFTSEESTCRATLKLWEEIYNAEYSDWKDKKDLSNSLFGTICNHCPCCEYASSINGVCIWGNFCEFCPMIDFWLDKNTEDIHTLCEEPKSPYNKWRGITCYIDGYSSEVTTNPEYIRMRKEHIFDILNRVRAAIGYWKSMKEMNTIW